MEQKVTPLLSLRVELCGEGQERGLQKFGKGREEEKNAKRVLGGFSFFLDCVLPREFYLVDPPRLLAYIENLKGRKDGVGILVADAFILTA